MEWNRRKFFFQPGGARLPAVSRANSQGAGEGSFYPSHQNLCSDHRVKLQQAQQAASGSQPVTGPEDVALDWWCRLMMPCTVWL